MDPPPPELVSLARKRICALSGRDTNEGDTGLRPEVFETYLELSGDPDTSLPGWLEDGAPLGIRCAIERAGIFPPVPDRTVEPHYIDKLVHGPDGWTNYRSAESEPGLTAELLDAMVNRGWATKHHSWGSLASELGTEEIVLNRLALITKEKPDGSLKHRLVWDLRRSGVNHAISQGERVVLPRLGDLVGDVLALAHGNEGPVSLLGTDVSDAFHQVPLRREERQFTVAAVDGTFYVFTVLVFGSGSAPTVWGRYSAFLGRSTAAVACDDPLRLQIYVDDPIYAAAGSAERKARLFAVALLWALVAGYPLAWKKTEAGSELTWIGALIRTEPQSICVAIPDAKAQELRSSCREFLKSNVCGVRRLRSFAGLVSFYAGLIPYLRPFLNAIWAALPATTGRTSELRRRLVYTKQIRRSLLWLLSFFSHQVGDLVRRCPFRCRESGRFTIVTDASPWGIGGVLYFHGDPVAYFFDALSTEDLRRFRAKIGVSDHTTTWEALAILVALRVWKPLFKWYDAVAVRSDSHGSLSAFAALASKSPQLNLLVTELSLDLALSEAAILSLTHIPGISNEAADTLSRLYSPDPKPLPAELDRAIQVMCLPLRDNAFYRAHFPPCSEADDSGHSRSHACVSP